MEKNDNEIPGSGIGGKIARGAIQTIGGAVPFVGGLFSSVAGAWSENEQDKVNDFFKHWIKMLEDEMKEKEKTIIEIMARIDMQDENISKRVDSKEYQSLIKKTFREWSGAENEEKRKLIRNILTNSAMTEIVSDDVVRLFIDWINKYSELHFQVISCIYGESEGVTRGEIWKKIGKKDVREDSSEADLYKLLIRDLSTGGIIRQHRATDYNGNFLKTTKRKTSSRTMKSAFDDIEPYELTELGKQFVHYAMTEITPRISYEKEFDSPAHNTTIYDTSIGKP